MDHSIYLFIWFLGAGMNNVMIGKLEPCCTFSVGFYLLSSDIYWKIKQCYCPRICLHLDICLCINRKCAAVSALYLGLRIALRRLQHVQLFFYLWFRRNIDPEVYCLVLTSCLIFLLNLISSWSSLRLCIKGIYREEKKIYDLSCLKSVLGKQSSLLCFFYNRISELLFVCFDFP